MKDEIRGTYGMHWRSEKGVQNFGWKKLKGMDTLETWVKR
jgi:hypothetical protein